MNNEEEKKNYVIPLAPTDLVQIYKVKAEDDDFVLFVDYDESRNKLSAKHIIIYLANTNFKTSFTSVDEDLLLEYIKSDFLIDSPMLTRYIVMVIKTRFQHPLNELEEHLLHSFSKERLHDFVDKNIELVDELCQTISSIIPFVLSMFYENLSEEDKKLEYETSEAIKEITVVDEPSNCGPNIARLVTEGWDGFLLICSVNGFSNQYNKQVFNNKPSYFGKDLFYILSHTRIVENILSMMPPGFITTLDLKPPLSDEELEAEIIADTKVEADDSTP
jgi:hypothetical protein